MARGAVLGAPETPRLASALRAFSRPGGAQAAPLDPEQLLLQRKEALAALHQKSRPAGDDGARVGSTALAKRIIPHWDKAPPSIREAYEKFLLAVGALAGGELPSSDLHEAAASAYQALQAHLGGAGANGAQGEGEGEGEGGTGALTSGQLNRVREALTGALGVISPDKALLERCLELARLLASWHNKSGGQQPQQPSPPPPPPGRGKAAQASSRQGQLGAEAAESPGAPEAQAWVALGRSLGLAHPGHAGGVSLEALHQRLGLRLGPDRLAPDGGDPDSLASGSAGLDRLATGKEGPQAQAGTSGAGPGRGHTTGTGSGSAGGGGGAAGGGGESGAAGAPRNLRWLWENCVRASEAGQSHFSSDELSLSVLRLLRSSQHGDEVAGELFNLIGDGGFDFIQELLQHRKSLVEAWRKGILQLRDEQAASGAPGTGGDKAPRHGATVTVQTETERQREKLRRKEGKKMARAGQGQGGAPGAHPWDPAGGDEEGALVAEAGGFLALVEAAESTHGARGMLDALIGTGSDAVAMRLLPVGTVRKQFKGYEEVHVPAPKKSAQAAQENLVRISELEGFAQTAFQGYQSLNLIQSRIYNKAFYSNENLLVCAPTGAGKTNIAMITVLREVGQNLEDGILQKQQFKVVYVAPMKALAAEMTAAFGRRLAPLGVAVRELTGDMQLTKREMEETQMIVTTPEKWDVITRKSSDSSLASLVRLLIIDEVHLLNDDRGPVIETIVARTLRQVEATQSMIRIVGLSATLPNYQEVAQFLRVTPGSGLFYFDASYRPVPLAQQYIGVSERNFAARTLLMHEICFEKALAAIKNGKQAMVFVHSRKDTVKTARVLVELAQSKGEVDSFIDMEHPQHALFKKDALKSRNRELGELFESGFGIHHAGMLRSDRSLTEKMFSEGVLKVLVCTATLAWGVNLPAHTVIIKGTQLYDAKAGGFRDLGILDVMQIFGRAGRPQFDTSGEGIILTSHDKLPHFLRLMTHQMPIESQFVASLKDNLNAEVVLGTVTNLREACTWLSYTYLYVRMQANPLNYGMTWKDVAMDPGLVERRRALIADAARALDRAKMMRFDERGGQMYVTELGRVASHFYLRYTSVETYNEMLKEHMSEGELLNLVAHSSEFENIVVREEEMLELGQLRAKACPVDIKGKFEEKHVKINTLLQVYLSRAYLDAFSLIADSAYISTSLGRIMRALFEICLRRGWCTMAALFLEYCKAVERRLWPHQHPLRQFEALIHQETLMKLEQRNLDLDRLYEMEEGEIAAVLRTPAAAKTVCQCLEYFPYLELDAHISPITRTVLQVVLTLTPTFKWKDNIHGNSQRWWVWVEDSENEHIYHNEYFVLTKKMAHSAVPHRLSFTIPIFEPLPSQYYVRAVSDAWLASTSFHTISFKHLILPERHPPHTELLNLRPLPKSALGNPLYESLYKFSHFNPIQTQAFHTLYHTDKNVLLGAPTGSGKTASAELAMLRLFSAHPGAKVVYVAPLKALVRERIEDWRRGLVPALGKAMVELTGDVTPDSRLLLSADIIVTTPEKWDGVTRNWQDRGYARSVGLMVIDEIHLLGQDRGPVLEVIVSRMRYIATRTNKPIRFLGLSTALANARDLGDWLGIPPAGLFNFKPSVRPVPLDVHIQGYPGKFYCPRMNAMNKPLYASILTHSPLKPVLVFVSSRRQTRLTALDLIQYAAADERPRQYVHIGEEEMEAFVDRVQSPELKHTLRFGVGLHHAGLSEGDRAIVESLFADRKIQVLVCTSTLAWGVNLPAHLVVVKGTEYYDGKTKRYVDFPITDVLQMMGRAGRPQFDTEAKAVILVHEPKKSFYKKFLYEPFPVESSLHHQLHDHLNAEVASGTILSLQDALDYLTWTFFFRRLLVNPSYYDLYDTSSEAVNKYLSELILGVFQNLERAGCLRLGEGGTVEALTAGQVASQYYLHFTSVALFTLNLRRSMGVEAMLQLLCGAAEFDELPVRHNEDNLNASLAQLVRWHVDARTLDDPHTKANLLLQCHFGGLKMPSPDYVTDLKSILDQTTRVIQAIVDICANAGFVVAAKSAMRLQQMLMQALWGDSDSPLYQLPHMSPSLEAALSTANLRSLKDLLRSRPEALRPVVDRVLAPPQRADLLHALGMLPRVSLSARVLPPGASGKGPRRPGGGQEKERGRGGEEEEGEGEVVVVEVGLERWRPVQGRSLRAYAPAFPKLKDEGWWLLLSLQPTQELLALRRLAFPGRTTTHLSVPLSELHALAPPKGAFLAVELVSDTYLGLDQETVVEGDLGSVLRGRSVTLKSEGHKGPLIAGAVGGVGEGDEEEESFEDAQDSLE